MLLWTFLQSDGNRKSKKPYGARENHKCSTQNVLTIEKHCNGSKPNQGRIKRQHSEKKKK